MTTTQAAPPAEAAAENVRRGVLAAATAYGMWGFFPLYFIFLRGVPADEILTQRILWSVPFGAAIIFFLGQWGEVRRGLLRPQILGLLLGSAFVIAANWYVYILAVQGGRIFESSLGYYINPLMYVLVGVVLLKEKLRQGQILAVILAALGVTILTIYGGRFPLISIVLAISFTTYGYIRKRVNIGAMPGLFIETVLLAPFAAAYFAHLAGAGTTGFGAALADGNVGRVVLLVMAGPLTVLPLLFFAIGARRLQLATLGFLQFIGPTLQFIVGLIDGEAFTRAHQICFGLIWLAALVFVVDAFRHRGGRA